MRCSIANNSTAHVPSMLQVGAVFLSGACRGNLTNTTVAGNSGTVAGAILVDTNSSLFLADVELSGNTLRRATNSSAPSAVPPVLGPFKSAGVALLRNSSADIDASNLFSSNVEDLVRDVGGAALFVGPGCRASLQTVRVELNDGADAPAVGVGLDGAVLRVRGVGFESNVPEDVGCVGGNSSEPVDGLRDVVVCSNSVSRAG